MNRTYVIAEMACSHEGEEQLARAIIDGAGAAGADAIQFQIWSVEAMMVPQHPQYELVAGIELSRDAWRRLAEHVRANWPDMHIIACVYEPDSVDFAESIGVDAWKFNSSDLSNPRLIRRVANTGRRIDLSVGASTLDEIASAVRWINETSDSDIWMMYGYQNFPTPTDAIHLAWMRTLKQVFGLPLGYQDHSDAESAEAFRLPAAAMGVGVEVLEKHITHDRSKKGIDHEAALNPDEFAEFVQMVRTLDEAMGSPHPRAFSEAEQKYRTYAKKSIVAARELAEGEKLSAEDLVFMRAEALGLPPDQVDRLVGRTVRRAIPAYHLVREEDVS